MAVCGVGRVTRVTSECAAVMAVLGGVMRVCCDSGSTSARCVVMTDARWFERLLPRRLPWAVLCRLWPPRAFGCPRRPFGRVIGLVDGGLSPSKPQQHLYTALLVCSQ